MIDSATWVGAHVVRNYVLSDPILDWLNIYGEQRGFIKDTQLPDYDRRTDMSIFLFRKGVEFEEAVVRHLKTLTTVVTICTDPMQARAPDMTSRTIAAMRQEIPIIHHGVLHDDIHQTYGCPDLIVRSDVLHKLFPQSLSTEDAAVPAPALKGVSFHYRIVDVKFTSLDLTVKGELGNSGSAPAYKAQLFIYNRALGYAQGYLPSLSYVLGRGWKQAIRGETSRGDSAMELLAPVPQTGMVSKEKTIATVVDEACAWIRRVRSEGTGWVILPQPSVSELRPNMGNTEDGPWVHAKKQIAEELEELTLLWQVGPSKRDAANRSGIYSWKDKRCTAAAIGISGSERQPVLQAILDINQKNEGPCVSPSRITAAEDVWREVPPLEFFVDFETVTDLNDDFSNFPQRGGCPMIFMIGCGHMENGQWRFKCFTATALTPSAEALIINNWFDHMDQVHQKIGTGVKHPVVYHWSPAETSNLVTAYNASVRRHPGKVDRWSSLQWFDFLKEVVRAEPVVVRGALGFGLKKIGRAMHQHGLIQTFWDAGPVDGLGAMVGAWWCDEEATKKRGRLNDIELMKEIGRYNEVDCKVMMEIVRHLRARH